MNNKLPEWRKALNSAVENYQSTQAWYEENPDNPAAEQDMDAAEGDIEKLLKQYGVLIVLSLMDEIDELQERRKADSAEPLAWTDEEELRDLRKVGFCEMFSVEPISKDADMLRVIPLYRHAQPAPVMPAELHPDTQNLVADFCTALAEKLYKAQLKYGYDADWKQDGWATQCLSHFHQHIAKGDPCDVAAYCAFMWYHGWKTESVSGPVVPEEMPKGLAGQIVSLLAHNIGDKLLAQKIWNACRAVMLQSKYRDLSQPVDPQISEYEKIMLRAGWVMVPVEPTDEMIAAAMNCEDVLFNSDESFCVQFGNIYEAMLAAAPQHEVK
ncbi:hypothetical protein S406_21155 [Salmonella enterica]|nr:hypothetical protein [Salmonella enterica]EBE4280753.1 hypothetical protein [Salmonella enterica subsp. enterica]RII62648.1 hypothetical protein BUJ39_0005560 [Salmonella enterica subsp. diarizonae serovar 16:z10:e,n,x,z15]EAO8952101.1 hypothetical protein [Salmonella enterica]EAQ5928650.1 hypothetical protein [Salmonella enterica]EAQ7264160.1 hypothetical protein [Salmonella enterica]